MSFSISSKNKILKTAKDWLHSYNNNNNTGNEYEIRTGISLLLGARLISNDDLIERFKGIQPFLSTNISGLMNLSQSDDIGGTGDIGIVFSDDSIKFFSVTKWIGSISKCICNPSGTKNYKLTKTPEIIDRGELAYQKAIHFRKEGYGDIPNKKWKRIGNCPGTRYMCDFLASESSKSWMSMTPKSRKDILTKMLDLNNKLTPNATGIIYWNKKENHIEKIYKWKLNIDIDNYLTTYNEGIYIYHGIPGNIILKTQTKYNNGIIEGLNLKIPQDKWVPKKSNNYISSWNCVAPDLNKIFKMKQVSLVE